MCPRSLSSLLLRFYTLDLSTRRAPKTLGIPGKTPRYSALSPILSLPVTNQTWIPILDLQLGPIFTPYRSLPMFYTVQAQWRLTTPLSLRNEELK